MHKLTLIVLSQGFQNLMFLALLFLTGVLVFINNKLVQIGFKRVELLLERQRIEIAPALAKKTVHPPERDPATVTETAFGRGPNS